MSSRSGSQYHGGAGSYVNAAALPDSTALPSLVEGDTAYAEAEKQTYTCTDAALGTWVSAGGGGGGVDTTAIHKATAGEISVISEKAIPTTADYLLIEDAADDDNKKRITINDLPSGGGGVTQWNTGDLSRSDRVVYVSKDGSDANDGSSINLAKLTVVAAKNHAVTMTPTAANPVVVLIHPGVYHEYLLLGSDDSYISYIGVGGPRVVSIVNDGNVCYLDRTNSTPFSIEIQGIHFGPFSTANNTPLTIAGDAREVVFRDCIFSARDKGAYIRGDQVIDVTVEFYDCVFIQELANDTCLDVSLVTADFYNCRCEGRVVVGSSGAVAATFHSCSGRGSLSGLGLWQLSDGATLLDCDIENESADFNSAAVRIDDTSGVIINGGRMFCGSGSDESIHALTYSKVGGSGTYMNWGFSYLVRREDFDPNIVVQSAGPGVDFYVGLFAALSANKTYGGVVHLTDDFQLTIDFDLEGGPITIDGGGQFAISMSTATADMFRQEATGPCNLTLRDVELTNGVIAWNQAQAGVLVLDHCTGGVKIVVTNYLAGKIVRLNDCLLLSVVTDGPVLDIQDTDTLIMIRNSYLAGNGTAPAILLTADNTEIDIAYTDIIADGQVVPISDPAAALSILSHHNLYSSGVFGSNLSNSITTPYDGEM